MKSEQIKLISFQLTEQQKLCTTCYHPYPTYHHPYPCFQNEEKCCHLELNYTIKYAARTRLELCNFIPFQIPGDTPPFIPLCRLVPLPGISTVVPCRQFAELNIHLVEYFLKLRIGKDM